MQFVPLLCMKFSSKILSQTVVQLCLAKGIDHIVISPGSRNAPLIIGFTLHPGFKCFSIVDERCAAFFALGMAQQLQKPVAVVCTSGSALLNYYPAVAEAFYSDIPLVVISADRPSHLIDVGDGQTIQQEQVFANHILYSANCKEGFDYTSFNTIEINKALNTALTEKGPIHINLPFSEPLYDFLENNQYNPKKIPVSNKTFPAQVDNLLDYINKWNKSSKRLVLVGVMPPNTLTKEVVKLLASEESTLVFTETTSNLHHPSFIPDIDMLISNLDEMGSQALQPEIVVTLGGMIVSKRIKSFLRKYPPQEHWHIDPKKAYNTFFCLSHHFKIEANQFLKTFLSKSLPLDSDYKSKWLLERNNKLQKQLVFEKIVPFSDFQVYATIFKSLPVNSHLQLANSTAIRYSQLFESHPSITVHCNRGTSGIDGSTSTAIGAATIKKAPTIFVTGDLSFFYDSNALWNNYIPKNFRIILVNNSGGGIFRILPKAKETPKFEEYLETKHQLTALHLCKMFGFQYFSASNKIEVDTQLSFFYNEGQSPKLLEIFTPSEANDKALNQYFKAIM